MLTIMTKIIRRTARSVFQVNISYNLIKRIITRETIETIETFQNLSTI